MHAARRGKARSGDCLRLRLCGVVLLRLLLLLLLLLWLVLQIVQP